MRKPRIVVVGGGPAGSSFSLASLQAKSADIILLDKSTYPRIKVCGSGLSPLALAQLEKLELIDRFEKIHEDIRGVRGIGPGGAELALRGGGKGAWVVPRHEFDHALVMEAVKLGADFRPGTKATELLTDGSGRVCGVRTSAGDVEADFVIGADGSPARFSPPREPLRKIQTLMGWWKGTSLPRDEAVMVWDRRLAGYYAWSFPEPNDVVNIGITIPAEAPDAKRLKDLFQDILDEHFAKDMQGSEQLGKWMGHPAIISTRVGKIATDRTMAIGEAARLVMPATVEGIGFALENGILAADIMAKYGDPTRGLSHAAQERFRRKTRRSVMAKFLVGEGFVHAIQNRHLCWAFGKLASPKLGKVVGRLAEKLTGDTDAVSADASPAANHSGEGSARHRRGAA